jgi:Fur family transcriptional regulator, ferric uptake regulator
VTAPADVHGEVASLLRLADQRYTPARRKIVEALLTSRHPMTIADLLAVLPDVAQSSLYRNLTVLENGDVVSRVVSTGDTGRYELSERLAGHHHHLVCSRCGSMRDVVISESIESMLDEAFKSLAKNEGFTLEHHRLDLVGVCGACRKGKSKQTR